MSDFIRFFCICISVLNVVSAAGSSRTNFASLPVELQASCLQDTSVKDKIELLKSASRSLLLHCIEIRKQALLFPKDLKSISDIPAICEIGANLEIIKFHTYERAWDKDEVRDILELEKLKCVILQTLEELEVTLDKVGSLLVKCDEAGIELGANTNVCELEDLKSTVRSLKSLDVLFPYSKVDLDSIYLSNPGDWVTVIRAFPATVRKIDLSYTNIDASVLLELSRLIYVEEIDLSYVSLTNPTDWIMVIKSLPVTVKKINLMYTNIDESGLRKLSRFIHLEEINLGMVNLNNPADWLPVIQSLPLTVKEISLWDSNIDVSGLRELSRLTSLEEIDLCGICLTNPAGWEQLIQSLPSTVRKIDLGYNNCRDDVKAQLCSKGIVVH